MNVNETCSCGASFSAEGDGVVRLLKEWRKTHACPERPAESTEGVFTVSNAQVEQAPMGFAPTMQPGRQDHGLEE